MTPERSWGNLDYVATVTHKPKGPYSKREIIGKFCSKHLNDVADAHDLMDPRSSSALGPMRIGECTSCKAGT